MGLTGLAQYLVLDCNSACSLLKQHHDIRIPREVRLSGTHGNGGDPELNRSNRKHGREVIIRYRGHDCRFKKPDVSWATLGAAQEQR